jgi:protein TonB
VGIDGRVTRCRVTRTSGNAELDTTTCQLIERRFRYMPARDRDGNPVVSDVGWRQTWWLESR